MGGVRLALLPPCQGRQLLMVCRAVCVLLSLSQVTAELCVIGFEGSVGVKRRRPGRPRAPAWSACT